MNDRPERKDRDRSIEVSHLIPLHRSARFHQVIIDNLRELSDPRDEIILSDRNGDVAYCAQLREICADVPNLRVLCCDDDASWVENTAGLIEAARGKYLRILPHDDSTTRGAVDAMKRCLQDDPGAVLVYGQIRAIDRDGTAMPERDQRHPNEDPDAINWTLNDVLPLFWTGRFGGAFKGMIRTDIAQHPKLRFAATPGLAHSERAWLFALGLAGRFRYLPQEVLCKRHYPQSTHRGWGVSEQGVGDVTDLMVRYAQAILPEPALQAYAQADLEHNAARRCASIAQGQPAPAYALVEWAEAARLRALPLGWQGMS